MVIGIDEVGRGAWAGPLLVIAARCKKKLPAQLADSKTISKSKREILHPKIKKSCEIGEGWVSSEEIDRIGLTKSMQIGVSRALKDIAADSFDQIIIDGHINYCPNEFINVRCEVRADSKYPIVSAASIYAKVTRDNCMKKISEDFPVYHFDRHVGYGTRLHIQMIKEHGICSEHRKSYKPIKAL